MLDVDDDTEHYIFHEIMNQTTWASLFLSAVPPTVSQLRIESKKSIINLHNTIMTKAGRITGTSSSSINMSPSHWSVLVYCINQCCREVGIQVFNIHTEDINIKPTNTNNKQSIINANLSLGATLAATEKITIKTKTSDGVAVLRNVFGSLIGWGIKAKPPPVSEINNPASNPRVVTEHDTINCVDVVVGGDPPRDWFGEHANVDSYEDGTNYIQLVYNQRTNMCRLTIKCYSIVSGRCTAPSFTQHMTSG